MSTYSTNLALELIGTGEQAGVWGTTTNTNLGTLIEQSISGYVTQAVATGTDTTITIPNGSSGVARNMYIELTGTGGASTNLVVPANKKLYFIFNNSTGAVTVKVSGQTGVSVPTGKKMVLVSNGTDIVNGLNYIADFASNSATITHLSATSASITNLTLTSLVISNLSIASANITTLTGSTQTLSGNLTLSGGTANGVLYLNGSKVATSGTALVFDGTNLGIGTTSPTQKLDVNGGAAVTGTTPLFLQRAVIPSFDGQGAPALDWQFYSTGTTYTVGARIQGLADDAWSSTSAPTSLRFYTAPSGSTSVSERMRISNAGNVGIGTASPTSYGGGYTTLEVAGSVTGVINLKAGSTVYGQMSTEANAYKVEAVGASTSLRFLTNSAERARIDSSGNLGIGTSSPGAKLQVVGEAIVGGGSSADVFKIRGRTSDGFGLLIFENSGGTDTRGYFGSPADNTFAWYDGGFTERMRLDSSGNLGLGVTPSAWNASFKAIEVGAVGNSIFSPTSGGNTLLTNNAYYDATGNWIYARTAAATHYEQISGAHKWLNAASGTAGNGISFTQAMTLDASGQLALGTTTATNTLTVQGTVAYNLNGTTDVYKYFTGGAGLVYAGTTTSTAIGFLTNGGERARITAAGGLAVGTTTDPGAGNIGLAASKGISFISGGFIASSQGQITVSGGTTTTFVTLSNANENRTYLVSVRQSGSQNNYVVGFATSYGANASIKRMVQDNAGGVTDMDFAISGLNLQLVLGAGFGSTTWDYIVTRLS
jgi:hypothetical protein